MRWTTLGPRGPDVGMIKDWSSVLATGRQCTPSWTVILMQVQDRPQVDQAQC